MGKQKKRVSILTLSVLPATAVAIDLQPGDLEPQAAGTQLLQFLYGDLERKGSYSNGRSSNAAAKTQTELYQLRYVRYFELGAMPASFYVQQPWGTIHVEGLGSPATQLGGHGDTAFLVAAWPHVDRERQTYVAMGAYYFSDNGSYDSRNPVNHGENRQRAALQVAYQARVAHELDWALAADVVAYGGNPAYGSSNGSLHQAQLYTVQSSLKYRLNPRVSLGLSLFHTFGGETSLNGTPRNDVQRTDRYLLTAAYALPALKSVAQVQYGRDLDVQTGLRETRRLLLRFTRSL